MDGTVQALMAAEATMRRVGQALMDARSERHRVMSDKLLAGADEARDALWALTETPPAKTA